MWVSPHAKLVFLLLTGSSAIEAVKGLDCIDIVVLFPEGRISKIQELQMTEPATDNSWVWWVHTSLLVDPPTPLMFTRALFLARALLSGCFAAHLAWMTVRGVDGSSDDLDVPMTSIFQVAQWYISSTNCLPSNRFELIRLLRFGWIAGRQL